MRKIIPLLAVLLGLSSCSGKLYESNWKEPETRSSAFRFYHPDSKIRYNVENDGTNIYFSFDVMDQLTIQKVLTTGLRLFVGGSTKKSEKMELQFPVYSDKVPVSELEEYGNSYDQSMLLGRERLDQMIPTDGYLKIGGEMSSIFNRMETRGTTVVLEFDSTRSLVYRAIIPLAAIKAESDIVSIGFETGGYEIPQGEVLSQADVTQANQGLTAGDRAMGRGNDPYGINTPGGSNAAGMAMRNSTAYNKFADPIRFWLKVKLTER